MDDRATRKKSRWGLFLLIWTLLLLLAGGACCYFLYQYLGVYEITRPDPVMDVFVSSADVSDLISQAKENVQFKLTEYEDPQSLYASYVDAIDTSRALTYRQDVNASSDEELVYTIRSGPNPICNVVLIPDGEERGFGRFSWRISEVRSVSLPELLPSVTITIDAISGEKLSLNGTALSEEDIVGKPEPLSDLNRFESELDVAPSRVEYQIGPLYGDVKLTNANGLSIPPDSAPENGTAHYQAFTDTQSLHIRAPEDLDVFINGFKLTNSDASSSSLGVLEGLEAYTLDANCKTNIYELDGFYLTPVVTAVEADGSEVTPLATAENSFTFFHKGDVDSEAALLPIAQSFFEAYMDYSSHAFEATRFSYLLGKTLPQSNLYQYIYDSQQAMYWASGTQTEYNDLRYENFHKVSDYCIICTVIYSADMTATNWYEQYSYKLENAYELAFVSTNAKWLAAGMNVITG